MANIPLNTIKFPGLNDTYTVPSNAGELPYNKNATYPDDTVGKALQDIGDSSAPAILETATGSIASFTDGANVPVKDLVAEIVPLQSGSGDPSPSNVRAISGWSECNVTVGDINIFDGQTESGYYDATDGSAKSSSSFGRSKNPIKCLPSTVYCMCWQGGASGSLGYILFYDANFNYISSQQMFSAIYGSTGQTFTTPNNCSFMKFYASSGNVEKDICINISNAEINGQFFPFATTYTIDWTSTAGTVYGGTLDVTSGVLTVDKIGVDLGSLDFERNTQHNNPVFYALIDGIEYPTTSSGIIPAMCEKYKQVSPQASNVAGTNNVFAIGYYYKNDKNINIIDTAYSDAESFKTACSGVKLVCKLITPQTYQLTPTEVKSLLKNNNIWADTGDVTVEYVADTKTFIENLVNA